MILAIPEQVKEILSDVLEISLDMVTESLSSDTCEEWDSERHISIILCIEERFGVTFSETEFLEVLNFTALCDAVTRKLGR